MADAALESQCLFCKIVRGEIPSARVLETDQAVVFLDINPLNPGHTLIVPRITGTWANSPTNSLPTPARSCPDSAAP